MVVLATFDRYSVCSSWIILGLLLINIIKVMFETCGTNIKYVRNYFLLPGDLYVSDQSTQVITVLGSCVAICLYDPTKGIGGINHYMLPHTINNIEDKLKYGDYSISLLLKKMNNLGVKSFNIRANIFGGSSQFHNPGVNMNVGKQNIDIAFELLEKHKVRIVGKDIGGEFGRKIVFYTGSGIVYQKLLSKNQYSIHAGKKGKQLNSFI